MNQLKKKRKMPVIIFIVETKNYMLLQNKSKWKLPRIILLLFSVLQFGQNIWNKKIAEKLKKSTNRLKWNDLAQPEIFFPRTKKTKKIWKVLFFGNSILQIYRFFSPFLNSTLKKIIASNFWKLVYFGRI